MLIVNSIVCNKSYFNISIRYQLIGAVQFLFSFGCCYPCDHVTLCDRCNSHIFGKWGRADGKCYLGLYSIIAWGRSPPSKKSLFFFVCRKMQWTMHAICWKCVSSSDSSLLSWSWWKTMANKNLYIFVPNCIHLIHSFLIRILHLILNNLFNNDGRT